MRIREIIWLADFVYKIRDKHGVTPEEVEYVLERRPHLRYVERGHVKGEDLYQAWGQTPAGRYLIVFFIHKRNAQAVPISARPMTLKVKRFYARQKKDKD